MVANCIRVFLTGQAHLENMLQDSKDILLSFQWGSVSNLKLKGGVTESDLGF